MILKTELKVCNRCIYDERVASISFDSNGVCNYCHQLDELSKLYSTGTPLGEKNGVRLLIKLSVLVVARSMTVLLE